MPQEPPARQHPSGPGPGDQQRADLAVASSPDQQPDPAAGQQQPAAGSGGGTLERELSLDAADLRSHGWYHGRLGRLEAEALLTADGDFLVRESTSQPGELALSCRWNNNNIHFMVNKMRVNADTIYESEQFFLEDEPFETVPHLVTSYAGAERAVSAASGARLRRPVNRTAALGGGGAPAAGRPGWRLLGNGGSAEQLAAGRLGAASSGSLPRLSAGPLYQQPGRLLRADRRASPPPKPSRAQPRPAEDAEIPDPSPAEPPAWRSPRSAINLSSPEPGEAPRGPLDAAALRDVALELLGTEPARLAAALTVCDLRLLQGEGGQGVPAGSCGIELLTLPHGSQLRQDLLERSEWFTAFVIASIVSLEDDDERVRLINRWIEVATETKTAQGNLYGFTNIVQALCSPQVQRLYSSWHQVRQRFTRSAVAFDAQLAPCVRRLAAGGGGAEEAPNTCLPAVAPLAALLEEGLAAEEPAADRLTAALQLLADGRRMAAAAAGYQRNSRSALAAAPLPHLFRTESQLRLLLGSRAAAADQLQRRQQLLPRLQQALAALADRRDPSPT